MRDDEETQRERRRGGWGDGRDRDYLDSDGAMVGMAEEVELGFAGRPLMFLQFRGLYSFHYDRKFSRLRVLMKQRERG